MHKLTFIKKSIWSLGICCLCGLLFTGCGDDSTPAPLTKASNNFSVEAPSEPYEEIIPETPVAASPSVGDPDGRDNTPVCLIPEPSGMVVYSNEVAVIDASHTEDGYICVKYSGTCSKVRLQISLSGSSTVYTYVLTNGDYETFPLTSGDGIYTIGIFENIQDTTYYVCLNQEISVTIADPFSPFLYPNQYVNFSADSEVVKKAAELAESASNDLDVVTAIYNFVTTSISYDYDKAANVASGYIPDADDTLQSRTGICLDYAAVMASMLRSQGIPTHLEVGYAGEQYHAWISTYVEDVGWINGVIQFDGKSWCLIDPTFAANSSESALKKFIGDGTNYTVKYVY